MREAVKTVKVYKFRVWGQAKGDNPIAPRMATKEFIQMAGGCVIDGSELEIDASELDDYGRYTAPE